MLAFNPNLCTARCRSQQRKPNRSMRAGWMPICIIWLLSQMSCIQTKILPGLKMRTSDSRGSQEVSCYLWSGVYWSLISASGGGSRPLGKITDGERTICRENWRLERILHFTAHQCHLSVKTPTHWCEIAQANPIQHYHKTGPSVRRQIRQETRPVNWMTDHVPYPCQSDIRTNSTPNHTHEEENRQAE